MLSKKENQLLTEILTELKEIKAGNTTVGRTVNGWNLANMPDMSIEGIHLEEPPIKTFQNIKAGHEGGVILCLPDKIKLGDTIIELRVIKEDNGGKILTTLKNIEEKLTSPRVDLSKEKTDTIYHKNRTKV